MIPAALLACALASFCQEPDELFLPEVDHEQRSVQEWMEVFEKSRGRDADALWSIFWWDDRSEEVIEFLESWRDSEGSPVRRRRMLIREVDTILDHWQVEHDCPSLEEYYELSRDLDKSSDFSPRGSLFSRPLELLEGTEASWQAALAHEDRLTRVRAATTLIANGLAAPQAFRVLVTELHATRTDRKPVKLHSWRSARGSDPVGAAYSWARSFAGNAADGALAELLLNEEFDVEAKRYLLEVTRFQPLNGSLPMRDALPLAESLLELSRGDSWLAPLARESLLSSSRIGGEYAATWREQHLHSSNAHQIEEDALAGVLAECTDDVLREIESRGTLRTGELVLMHNAGRAHGTIRDRVEMRLTAWLDRDDELATTALTVLCHVEASSERVKAAYVRHLESFDASDPAFTLPCLAEHDDRTRAAFERVAPQVSPASRLFDPAEAGGFLDDPGSLASRLLVAHAREDNDFTWRHLFEAGFTVELEIPADADPAALAPMLGIRIRALRASSKPWQEDWRRLFALLRVEFDELDELEGNWGGVWHSSPAFIVLEKLGAPLPEFADWALSWLTKDFWLYNYDICALQHLLEEMELNQRQIATACSPPATNDDSDPERHRATFGSSAIAHAPLMRSMSYRSTPVNLREVLEITKLSGTDQEYLQLAARRSSARYRGQVIDLVEEFELDTKRVREMILEMRADIDPLLASRATAIAAARDW